MYIKKHHLADIEMYDIITSLSVVSDECQWWMMWLREYNNNAA
jgi:hypothetical protein